MELSGQYHTPVTLSLGRNCDTHWVVGWMGTEAGLDNFEKKKSLAPTRISTLGHPAHCVATVLTMLFHLQVSLKGPQFA